MLLNVSDLILFFGRFHPLVVHLPIGILFLAAMMALLSRKKKFSNLRPALDFVLLVGALSAAVACMLGLMLSSTGGYDQDSLFWHQWAGILLTGLAFTMYWLRTGEKSAAVWFQIKYNRFAVWLLLFLLACTGHLGGNLTHGSDYLLQHAPDFLRAMRGLDPKPIPRPPVTVLDSADIFLDAVHPLIQSKCQSCHNDDKKKGGLMLTNYEEMIRGGKNGSSVIPGDPENSILYRRVSLPKTHDDYMPAEGKPGFDDDELALVKWWIEQGAPPSMLLADMEKEINITSKLERMFGIHASDDRLPDGEATSADSTDVNSVRAKGFLVKQIAPESNYLEIRLPYTDLTLNDLDIEILLLLKDQIAWLNLSNGEVGDGDLEVIGQLERVNRLNLANNPITDKGLAHLGVLEELNYLNLYGTRVSDEGLNALQPLKKLKSLYLWQTKVSAEGITTFLADKPNTQVTTGLTKMEGSEEPEKE